MRTVIAYERPLDLLEVAYRLEGSDDDWMRELVQTAAKVFAREGLGAGGFFLRGRVDAEGRTLIAAAENPKISSRARIGSLEASLRSFSKLPTEVQESLGFSSTVASTMSTRPWVGADLPQWLASSGWDPSKTKDALGLVCHAGGLSAAFLGVGLRDVTTLEKREQRLGTRITAHIGAALRLRRGSTITADRAEAVLSPKGRIQHLARTADGLSLREGFDRRREARTRHQPAETALEIWQGLHDGRWSLVDHVDTDGKVFVLALRNEPGRDVACALTDRQRGAVSLASLGYGNKQIAYALGLSVSAVGMLLTRARAATGTRTRADLVRRFKCEMTAEP